MSNEPPPYAEVMSSTSSQYPTAPCKYQRRKLGISQFLLHTISLKKKLKKYSVG